MKFEIADKAPKEKVVRLQLRSSSGETVELVVVDGNNCFLQSLAKFEDGTMTLMSLNSMFLVNSGIKLRKDYDEDYIAVKLERSQNLRVEIGEI